MTVLQPVLLWVALVALPILVFLYFWQRRPRPLRVPSIEVWQQVLERLPETAVRRTRRRWPDPRLWLALLVLVLLALAAGNVSLVPEAPEPREVRVVLDRSLWMQLPLAEHTEGASDGAWPLALERAAEFAEALHADDRVTLELVPPLVPGELAERPETHPLTATTAEPSRLATALRAVAAGEIPLGPVDSAPQGALAAALADALAWSAQQPRRRVLAMSTQPLRPRPAVATDVADPENADAQESLAMLRWPLAPELVHLRRVALDERELLVELVAPPQRNVTVTTQALDSDGAVRADVPPVRRDVRAATNENELDPATGDANAGELALRRTVLPRPDLAAKAGDDGGVAVRVDDALPARRAAVAQPIRVAVRLPVELPEETAEAWLDWLAAMFPAVTFERMPHEGEVELARPDVLLTASAGRLHEQGLGTAPPPRWHDVPRLVVGPVPAPANPFVKEDVAPEPLDVAPRRRVDNPSHALLQEVPVAHVQLPDVHRMERGLGMTRFEPVLSVELAEARNGTQENNGEPRYAPLVVVAEEGPARGVLIAGSTPLTHWPQRGGFADALLLANAFSYLVGESAAAHLFEDAQPPPLRATLAGEPFELPAWAAWRREREAPLQLAWRDAAFESDGIDEGARNDEWQEVNSLSQKQHRAGWLRVARPNDEAHTVMPRQAGRLDLDALQAAYATADYATGRLPELADWLPASRTESAREGRPLWLLLALLAAVLYAYGALRRRSHAR